MANVVFPRREFEKCLGKKIDKEIEEKISMLGTPLEKITSEEIEIEVFPNRPDFLSMHGYARAFKAFLGIGKPKDYKINKPEKDYIVKIDKSVKAIRPFCVCGIVKNLKFDDEKIKEIVNFQEKMHATIGRKRKKLAIGIYPVEKIAFPITYKAENPYKIKFIPLEAKKEMNGLQILKQHPAGREYAHLLENAKKFPVFVDANKKVLSMPPIINSHETGKITTSTTDVFVECSGTDLNILKKTLCILITTLTDMGGTVYGMRIQDTKSMISPDMTAETHAISLGNVNKLLGLNLKEKDLVGLLKKMGHEYKNKKVYTPAWRTDILHEVDLIEDVAIAYGYENLAPELPKIATIGEELMENKIKSKLSEILIGLQFTEISSYHLIKSIEAKKVRLESFIEIEDSKTDYKILRPNLFIPALRILSENKDNEYPQNIFEIGTVFKHDSKHSQETRVEETDNLLIALAPGNFTQAKQCLNYLMKVLKIEYKLRETAKPGLITGRIGEIYVSNSLKSIGYLGEVHPSTLRAWNLKMPLAVIEISLKEIFNLFNK